MDNMKILEDANIPNDLRRDCYISDEREVFTPIVDNGVIVETAVEVYQQWLENKDKPPKPSDTEILAQSVYEMAEIIELILMGGIE